MKKGGLYLLVLLSLAVLHPTAVSADWSVWETPAVYYDFESVQGDGATMVKDRVGGNDLALRAPAGSATGLRSRGKYGRAAAFDGDSDYGLATDAPAFAQTGSFSVEAWVRFEALSPSEGAIQTLLGRWDETGDQRSYRLIVQTDAHGRAWPAFQVSPDGTAASIKTATGKTRILPGQWYLLQGYYDADSPGTIYLYVNGVREGATAPVGTTLGATSADFHLGATKTGASTYEHFLHGALDEVRLFSGARAAGALAYSMERGKPVVKMNFDDGSGFQTMNRAPNYSRAALIGFPTDNSQWVAGNNNYALEFNGTGSYVDLGNHARFQLGGAITISAWIHVSSLGNYALVSQPHTDGYTFQLTSAGELAFGAVGATTVTSSGANITTDEWTHVVVSYDGANAHFYVDGRLVSSPALSSWSVANGSVFIGRAGSPPNYFTGKMDDLLIYAYDRSLFEVYADMLGGAVHFGRLQALEPANAQVACPQGFIHVPGDPLYGTSDFCVMKYEAKAWDVAAEEVVADGGVGLSGGWAGTNDQEDYLAISTHEGRPWVNIAQEHSTNYDAKQACADAWQLAGLPEGSTHLITNNQWMTIARNVAQVADNWTGGSVGSGMLRRGHSDGNPSNSLAASNDSEGWHGMIGSNFERDYNRRTLTLSNGEVIWDLAGNIWNWIDEQIAHADKPDGAGTSWTEWTNVTDHGPLGYDAYRPSNDSWNSAQGIGQYYEGSASPAAFPRGGAWAATSTAGVLALSLNTSPTSQSNTLGFRCAVSRN